MLNRGPWIGLAIVVAIAGAIIFYLSSELIRSDRLNSQTALAVKCSIWAATFYKNGGWSVSSQGLASYKDHWNSKMHKCFIEVDQPSNDGFLSIDVFDALESKRYALFIGHQICDAVIVGKKTCQFDSGQIWLNGDDSGKPDVRVGYGGLAAGKVGNADTLKDFLSHIHPLMNG